MTLKFVLSTRTALELEMLQQNYGADTRTGISIRKRCVSRPTEHQAILLQRLGLELPTLIERADL